MPAQPWSREEYVEAFLTNVESDYLALWEVAHILRETGVQGATNRYQLGTDLVRDLVLKHGLVAGFLADGGGFAPWPLDPVAAVARIDTEWQELGRDPNISEICWFTSPRPEGQQI